MKTITLAALLGLLLPTYSLASGKATESTELYAWLHKPGPHWVFDQKLMLSPKPPSAQGISIALSDLKPVRNVVSYIDVSCAPVWRHCKAQSTQSLDKKKTASWIQTHRLAPAFGPFAQRNLKWPHTIMRNSLMLIPTLGTSIGSRSHRHQFDQTGFEQALQQALNAKQLDQLDREAILRDYKKLLNASKREFRTVLRAYRVARQKYKGFVRWDNTIQDYSGLWDNTEDANIKISINKPELAKPKLKVNFKAFLASFGKNTQSDLYQLPEHYKEQLHVLKNDWYYKPISFKCDYVGSAFNIEFECPPPYIYRGRNHLSQVDSLVMSKNQRLQFPAIANQDSHLVVRMGKDGFIFENQSDQSITLQSISLLWGGRVVSRPLKNITLAAHSRTHQAFSLNNFDTQKLAAGQSFIVQDATSQSLEELNVLVGFAVKYRLDQTGQLKTNYTQRRMSGLQLVPYSVQFATTL
jgi:hypothetical protein